uniref:Putative secreted protein n=1 Tax=Anopheles triannulatus TaxID=58253 RepID=A0A2M4B3G5_9DIPT
MQPASFALLVGLANCNFTNAGCCVLLLPPCLSLVARSNFRSAPPAHASSVGVSLANIFATNQTTICRRFL